MDRPRLLPDLEAGNLLLRTRGGVDTHHRYSNLQHSPLFLTTSNYSPPDSDNNCRGRHKPRRCNWKALMFLRRRLLTIICVLLLSLGTTLVVSLLDITPTYMKDVSGKGELSTASLIEIDSEGQVVRSRGADRQESESREPKYVEEGDARRRLPREGGGRSSEKRGKRRRQEDEDSGDNIDPIGVSAPQFPEANENQKPVSADEEEGADKRSDTLERQREVVRKQRMEPEEGEMVGSGQSKAVAEHGEGHGENGREAGEVTSAPTVMQSVMSFVREMVERSSKGHGRTPQQTQADKQLAEQLLNAAAQAQAQAQGQEQSGGEESPANTDVPSGQATAAIPQTASPSVEPRHVDVAMAWARQRWPRRSEVEERVVSEERREAVHGAIMHAWNAYKQYAWGMDELMPIAQQGQNWFGLMLTIIDSLDLLWLIGEKEEFRGAQKWIEKAYTPMVDAEVNVFEVTIRVVGGLLSAYALSKEEIFLTKAKETARQLQSAFDTPSHIPWSDCNIKEGHCHAPEEAIDSSTSEVTSLQMEFKYLAYLINEYELFGKAEDAMSAFEIARQKLEYPPAKVGLVPMFINAQSGKFSPSSTITLGARGDSYYEYLLKQWLQTGKVQTHYFELYNEAIDAIRQQLLGHTYPRGIAFVGELLGGQVFSPKMDHLACFLPGTLALGYYHDCPEEHLQLAKDLMVTCFEYYNSTVTGLAPEIAYFNTQTDTSKEYDMTIHARDTHNILRPETVESLYYLHRITGDPIYREWAWQIFQAFEKHSRIASGGYSGIINVQRLGSARIDKMESFFLGETLKYLYLIFCDDNLAPFDQYVFNTEAHPLPIFQPPSDWMLRSEGSRSEMSAAGQNAPRWEPALTAAEHMLQMRENHKEWRQRLMEKRRYDK